MCFNFRPKSYDVFFKGSPLKDQKVNLCLISPSIFVHLHFKVCLLRSDQWPARFLHSGEPGLSKPAVHMASDELAWPSITNLDKQLVLIPEGGEQLGWCFGELMDEGGMLRICGPLL